MRERAKQQGREGQVKFAINSFVIARETEEEAVKVLQEIQGKADKEAVEGFADQVKNAGASTQNKQGMWASSKVGDPIFGTDLRLTEHSSRIWFSTTMASRPSSLAHRNRSARESCS